MSKQGQERASINQGIQAGSVQAEVMAVGTGASATKNVTASSVDHEALAAALGEIRAALDGLVEDAGARKIVEQDVQALEQVLVADEVDAEQAEGILTGLAAKLRMAGVVLSDAKALAEPVTKIAKMVGVSLAALGLL